MDADTLLLKFLAFESTLPPSEAAVCWVTYTFCFCGDCIRTKLDTIAVWPIQGFPKFTTYEDIRHTGRHNFVCCGCNTPLKELTPCPIDSRS
jgi:hypothetical protein